MSCQDRAKFKVNPLSRIWLKSLGRPLPDLVQGVDLLKGMLGRDMGGDQDDVVEVGVAARRQPAGPEVNGEGLTDEGGLLVRVEVTGHNLQADNEYLFTVTGVKKMKWV